MSIYLYIYMSIYLYVYISISLYLLNSNQTPPYTTTLKSYTIDPSPPRRLRPLRRVNLKFADPCPLWFVLMTLTAHFLNNIIRLGYPLRRSYYFNVTLTFSRFQKLVSGRRSHCAICCAGLLLLTGGVVLLLSRLRLVHWLLG